MNTRVLELIKNPKTITQADLSILQSETEKMPYAQSVRALYLYGINLYQPEKYKENLSKTAAYTTDKKILYHFINSQKSQSEDENLVQKIIDEKVEHKVLNENVTAGDILHKTAEAPEELENTAVILNKFDIDKIIETESLQSSEYIVVDGEKNRLLYEGEENFLEEKPQEIDIEATKESGLIVVKDDLEIKENLIVLDENRSEENFSNLQNTEDVVKFSENESTQKELDAEDRKELHSADISFNGIEDFLPQVKFSVPKNHLDYLNPPKKELKKDSSVKAEETVAKSNFKENPVRDIDENDFDNDGISFENTQVFDVPKPETVSDVKKEVLDEIAEKGTKDQIDFDKTQSFATSKSKETLGTTQVSESENLKEEEKAHEQPVSTWKPMSFSVNIPDALIGKIAADEIMKPEIAAAVTEKIKIEEEPIVEEKTENVEMERAVMNVSFFGDDVSKIEEKEQEKEIPAILDKVIENALEPSNVGTFINTWQNWLKIDRPKEEETVEKTIVVKEKIIDQFIEKNPRISQLKDEVSFVVKEKKDDISHLMTETLAKLYTEQKLYAKAIKAYEILSAKHPLKKEYFQEKIEEVKEIRKS